MDNVRTLDIPGAKQKVEVDGVLGIFYKVRVGGQVIKRSKGHWAIPMKGGRTGRLTSNGVIPGFQTLRFDGEPVFKLGAHVQTPEKVAMFAPLLLVAWMPFGFILAVLDFLMSVMIVKNPQMPQGLRIALPVLNTVVFGAVLSVLFGTPW